MTIELLSQREVWMAWNAQLAAFDERARAAAQAEADAENAGRLARGGVEPEVRAKYVPKTKPISLRALQDPPTWAAITAAWASKPARAFREAWDLTAFVLWINGEKRAVLARMTRIFTTLRVGVAGRLPAGPSKQELAARAAAASLAAGTVMSADCAELPAEILFGKALLGTSEPVVAISDGHRAEMTFRTSHLRNLADALRPLGVERVYIEFTARWGSEPQLCVRWRGGKGGVNLYSGAHGADDYEDRLLVTLPPLRAEREPAPASQGPGLASTAPPAAVTLAA